MFNLKLNAYIFSFAWNSSNLRTILRLPWPIYCENILCECRGICPLWREAPTPCFFQIFPKNPKLKKFKKISSVGERWSIEDFSFTYSQAAASDLQIFTFDTSWCTYTEENVTAPDRCYCLNQASLTRNKGRAGEFPVGKTNRSQTATEVVIK